MSREPFDLPAPPSRLREDFIVGEPNAFAFDAVAGGGDWRSWRLILVGPPKSGKSHLAHIWSGERRARALQASLLDSGEAPERARGADVVVEDAESVAGVRAREVALFHLCNAVAEGGRKLLLTARTPPSSWRLELADLRSRMEGSPVARLEPPDDLMLRALLVKHFSDRQIAVPARILKFVLPRMTRSYEAAHALADELDRLSLAAGRSITMAMVNDALGRQQAPGDGQARTT